MTTPAPENPENRPKLHVDWARTIAGGLAAISSAVLLSTLGAAGTLVGAALGSVIVSITSNLYGHGLDRGRSRVANRTSVLRHGKVAQTAVSPDHPPLDDTPSPAGKEPGPGLRARLAALPWRRVALVAVGFFVIAAVLITGFELIVGRPVSSYTGGSETHSGTSWTRIDDHGPAQTDQPSPTPTPSRTPGSSPSSTPTQSPTPDQTPSAEPTEIPAPTTEPPAPTDTADPGNLPDR